MKNFLLLTLTLWCFFAHAQLSQQFIRVHNVADLATLISIASPMSAIFEKYFKWEKQAVEMKVEIKKSIKQISNLTAGFTFGSGDWNIDFSSTIGASFFSQSTTNHQLVLSFEKLQSSDNEYITHNLERIYFSKEQVQEIAKGFDSGYIKSFLEKRKSQLKTHLNNSKR